MKTNLKPPTINSIGDPVENKVNPKDVCQVI